jgi:glutathione peroxidase
VSDLYDIPIHTLQGEPSSLAPYKGKALLLVNVASRCGLTPQYTGLQKLQDSYGSRGFSVLGFPCNQFLEQEPGTPDEIAEFCSVNYGVTFPLFEKIEVNGPGRHALYDELTAKADAEGTAGDIQWNFEKFLVSPEGEIVARFRPGVEPEDPGLVGAVEGALPSGA